MTEEPNIRKEEEFEAFIKQIEEGQLEHWTDIAKAIGIDKDTITEWRKLPRAREAITKGINRAIQEMESAGKKDWRMWESKLKMLGVSPVEKQDLTSEGEKLDNIIIYRPEKNNDMETPPKAGDSSSQE